MEFKIGTGGEVKVVLVYKDDEFVEVANDAYLYAKDKGLFKGNVAETYSNITYNNDNVIFLGMGERNKLSLEVLRKSFCALGKEAIKYKVKSIDVELPKFDDLCYRKTVMSVVEGLLQSEYSFEKFLTEKKLKPTLEEVFLTVVKGKEDAVRESIIEAENIVEGIFVARDLVNEPAINMYPEVLADSAIKELEGLEVKVDVFGKQKIEELGMHAFLSVARGSAKEPKFIVMSYEGNPQSKEKIALVGKGLTYDSGGYCLKTDSGMKTMHSDMAGSASVIGALKAIAKSKIKKNVVAIVAACENMISGDAYKTGDIIGSMSGKTIEVGNTDAEGRLTLADALWYASTVEKADKIVDVATLTGACVVALGHITTGAITNNESFMKDLKEASYISGENVWELPNFEEYKESYKADFADLSNMGKDGAGTITAGLFLSEFVNDTPWIHLDIAGTSYSSSKRGYLPKGATGVPVKTLYYLVKEF